MSETRCPECQCLLKDKDLKNDKCWKCGLSPVREIIEKIQNIEVTTKSELKEKKKQERLDEKEKKKQELENRIISEKYSILRIFQLVIGFSIFIYSYYFIIFLGDLYDLGFLHEDNLDKVIIPFLLFLFNSICVILVVNFIFELDKQKSDKK
jgi:uncharacterized membrane-anchored protein|tara:strand:+ start:249 stop:704 length:456 start_codon:yes stop_codon:yes gene_type:complete